MKTNAAAAPNPAPPEPPPTPAPVPAPSPAPVSLSTASLSDQLRKQFSEPAPAPAPEPPAPAPAPEPAPEPAPAPQPPDPMTTLRADLETERQRNRDLDARLAKLEGKPAGQPAAPEPVPIRHTDAAAKKLADQEAQKSGVAQWARTQLRALNRNPEAVKAELARQKIDLGTDDPEAMADWLESVHDEAERSARELAVERAVQTASSDTKAEAERGQARTAARYFAPEIDQPESNRAKLYRLALEQNPAWKTDPRGELYATALTLGWEQMHTTASQAAAPPGNAAPAGRPRPAAPRLPGAGNNAPAPPAPSAGDTVQALFEKFRKSNDPKDREAWMLATIRTPQTA